MSSLGEVCEKVARILFDVYGEFRVDDDGEIEIPIRKTACFVNFDGVSIVILNVYAPILRSVPLSNALSLWVATSGQEFQIGSVALEMDDSDQFGSLFYRYALVGNDVDPLELEYAVSMVGYSADRLIKILQPTFGGESYFQED
jgi:hypothetical protein